MTGRYTEPMNVCARKQLLWKRNNNNKYKWKDTISDHKEYDEQTLPHTLVYAFLDIVFAFMFIMMFPGVFIVHFLNNGNSLSFFMYRNEPGTAIRLDSTRRYVVRHTETFTLWF